MRAEELGELYTYLKLFGQIYTDCERERQILENGIEEVFGRKYGDRNVCESLKVLKNPRKAGRRNEPETQERIKALLEQGRSIREISVETGIPKSTVQRLKKEI